MLDTVSRTRNKTINTEFVLQFYSSGEDRLMDRQLQYYEISVLMKISSKGYVIYPSLRNQRFTGW